MNVAYKWQVALVVTLPGRARQPDTCAYNQ